ncbi:MAG TPA: hypothetical protein VMH91_01210 [Candidatus Paceibacterota bacterium]|nr:hypothetical protein [Candidatus Paceibacterota bacterium]
MKPYSTFPRERMTSLDVAFAIVLIVGITGILVGLSNGQVPWPF